MTKQFMSIQGEFTCPMSEKIIEKHELMSHDKPEIAAIIKATI